METKACPMSNCLINKGSSNGGIVMVFLSLAVQVSLTWYLVFFVCVYAQHVCIKFDKYAKMKQIF